MTRRTVDPPTPSAIGAAATGKRARSSAPPGAGDNERATRKAIALFDEARVAARPDLAALALTLARALDAGMGLATAGVSKELRATMAELQGVVEDVDDDDPVDAWLRGLTDVGNAPQD